MIKKNELIKKLENIQKEVNDLVHFFPDSKTTFSETENPFKILKEINRELKVFEESLILKNFHIDKIDSLKFCLEHPQTFKDQINNHTAINLADRVKFTGFSNYKGSETVFEAICRPYDSRDLKFSFILQIKSESFESDDNCVISFKIIENDTILKCKSQDVFKGTLFGCLKFMIETVNNYKIGK